MPDVVMKNFPLFGVLGICLVGLRRFQLGLDGSSQFFYRKLKEEEKCRYDEKKMKRAEVGLLIVTALITTAALIPALFFPGRYNGDLFDALYVADLAVWIFVFFTPWGLRLFRRKDTTEV